MQLKACGYIKINTDFIMLINIALNLIEQSTFESDRIIFSLNHLNYNLVIKNY